MTMTIVLALIAVHYIWCGLPNQFDANGYTIMPLFPAVFILATSITNMFTLNFVSSEINVGIGLILAGSLWAYRPDKSNIHIQLVAGSLTVASIIYMVISMQLFDGRIT